MAEPIQARESKLIDALILVAAAGWMPNERNWDAETTVVEISEKIYDLCVAGVTAEGAHAKQWYLEQIADVLGVELPEHDKGIAP